jgi:exodeoxyribonuclease V beta subunit
MAEPAIPREEHHVDKFTSGRISAYVKPGSPLPRHPFFEACDRIDAAVKLFSRALVDLEVRFLERAKTALDETKRAANVFTFDDLLGRMDEALDGPEAGALIRAVKRRYKAVLIDEFQDTDPVQYRIFHRIYKGDAAPFFLIGDPKQSIYGFRGADIFTYFRAARDAGDNAHTLGVNWRSSPGQVAAVNTLFQNVPRPFLFERIAFEPVAPAPTAVEGVAPGPERAPLEVRFVPRESAELGRREQITARFAAETLPDLVASDMTRLLEEPISEGRPPLPSRAAVLVRTNEQARRMQDALKAQGIEGVIWGASSIFHSEEAAELAWLLAALEDPGNLPKRMAALSTSILGLGAPDIAGLRGDTPGLDAWSRRMTHARRLLVSRGVMPMFHHLLSVVVEQETIGARILKTPGGERKMTNLRHLAELLGQKAAEDGLGISGLCHWFSGVRSAEAGEPGVSGETELRLESDEDAVRIITVYKAKGLEFDLVYCPYLWNGLHGVVGDGFVYHDAAQDGRAILDLGTEEIAEHRAQAAVEEMAEGLRLAYVALTRARYRTVAVWGAFHGAERSPLGYLLHHPGGDAGLGELARTIETLDDDALRAGIDRLSERSRGAILRTGFHTAPPAPPGEGRPRSSELFCRRLERPLPQGGATWSFTSLTSGSAEVKDWEDGADRDEAVDEVAPTRRETEAGPGSGPPLIAFERGARAGRFIHAVFEHLDFAETSPGHLEKVVADQLAAYGFGPEWLGPVSRGVAQTLEAPLAADDPRRKLKNLAGEAVVKELEFLFPLEADQEVGIATRLSDHGASLPLRYADDAGKLDQQVLGGFMKGFIDLLFSHDGRFYIADYKSNYLGQRNEDYGQEALERCMASHSYYLQYLIYTVAAHRFLGLRVPGYDYDRHFGGVYYLFVRGISPRTGVFFDRPEKALVSALSDCLSLKEVRP